MHVILLEKIGKLGEIGDTANVKSGYARNFLFPQGKAIPASRVNLADFEQRKSELLAAHDTKIASAQKRATQVDGIVLTIEVNASDEGKLFGSVGTRDIAEAINTKSGGDIAKSEVLLPNGAIRELGNFEITLDLGYEVHASVSLSVVSLTSAAAVSDDGSIIEEIEEAEAKAEAKAKAEASETDTAPVAPSSDASDAEKSD